MSRLYKLHMKHIDYSILVFVFIHIFFATLGYLSSTSTSGQFIEIENSILTYFINNFLYSLILVSGFVSFGLITVFMLSINSYILGEAIKGALLLGNDITYILFNLMHGLFEIPALYFFYKMGIAPLEISLKHFFSKRYKFSFYEEARNIGKNFASGTALLFAAAVLEYFIAK